MTIRLSSCNLILRELLYFLDDGKNLKSVHFCCIVIFLVKCLIAMYSILLFSKDVHRVDNCITSIKVLITLA